MKLTKEELKQIKKEVEITQENIFSVLTSEDLFGKVDMDNFAKLSFVLHVSSFVNEKLINGDFRTIKDSYLNRNKEADMEIKRAVLEELNQNTMKYFCTLLDSLPSYEGLVN